MGGQHEIHVVDNREDGLEKAISWQRYKIVKVLGRSANEPTWLQLLSHVCSFYSVGTIKVGNLVVDNQGLTLRVPVHVYYALIYYIHKCNM